MERLTCCCRIDQQYGVVPHSSPGLVPSTYSLDRAPQAPAEDKPKGGDFMLRPPCKQGEALQIEVVN